MNNRFVVILLVIVIGFFGVVAVAKKKNKAELINNNTGTPSNHIEGKNSAGVTLTEYGDYQCPFCGNFYPTVKQVVEQYKDKISFQFRNLPLTSLHPNAFAAARAAEAASLQGKFWQMHDILYERQTQWSSSNKASTIFADYASELNLNVDKFKTDMASEAVNNTINADLAAFSKTGDQQSTPTFYLDGKKVEPNNDAADFQKLLDEAIKAKS